MSEHLMTKPSSEHLFLAACQGQPVERPPVWIMRQAGRYLPEYRAIRAQVDFLTLCKTPDLAAEVTLQPIDIVGVDAAIIFADILLILESMGAELKFVSGKGPVFGRPIRSAEDLGQLRRCDVSRDLGFVYEAIRVARRALDGRVPVIGFAGTPWTLAAYLVEGGVSRSFSHLLGWSYRDPKSFRRLLDTIADATADYLEAQIDAGAEAIQLFDTWGGLLDRTRWSEIARPSVVKILERLHGKVPLIYYCRNSSHLLEELARLPIDVLSVDWRVSLTQARRVLGADRALQGNLDPGALLGDRQSVERAAKKLLSEIEGPHIANLGHGILPMTPVENARAFVDTVKASAD